MTILDTETGDSGERKLWLLQEPVYNVELTADGDTSSAVEYHFTIETNPVYSTTWLV